MKQQIFFDAQTKSLTSFRDGVQEYYGYEIDKEPSGKVFTVYRAPEQIALASDAMPSLHITDQHIPLDSDASKASIGAVITSAVVSMEDSTLQQTVAVKNKISASSELLSIVDSGPRELSLGYKAEMKPHDKYDFEQINIKPHHLAIVDAGRCGSVCSFNDKTKGINMTEDEIKAKDEAAKKLADEEAQKIKDEDAKKLADEEAQKLEDEEAAKKSTFEKGKKPDFSDSKEFHDAVTAAATVLAVKMTDAAMAKELPLRVVAHAQATEKGRDYLDTNYAFADKTPCQIKRDVLATQTDRTFSDAELDAAFDVLSIQKDYSNFADKGKSTEWADMANEEIGAKQ